MMPFLFLKAYMTANRHAFCPLANMDSPKRTAHRLRVSTPAEKGYLAFQMLRGSLAFKDTTQFIFNDTRMFKGVATGGN